MTDGLWVARSTDNGARWTGRLAVANGYTGSGCTGPDRPTVAVDPVRGIVWVAYTHLVFTSMPCAAAASTDIRVVRSTDGGRTWSKPVVVASDPTVNPSAAVPAVLPDGSVAVAFLQGTDLVLTQRRCAYYSSVRLATVSQQLKVSPAKVLIDEVCGGPSGTASPGSFQTVPPSPTVAVNPRTGMLAVAASDTSAALPSVRLAVTRDAGKTFTVQNLAVSIGEAPIMPQLAFGAGRFALSYLAALPGSVYRPRLVYSRDDGRTWSDPTELATQPSLGNAKPQVLFLDPFSIGHYQGLAIGPDGVAHAAWPDLRISQTPQSTRTFVRGAKLE